MASRENTTLQGTIIALVLLLLGMFVVVFLLNNALKKQQALAASSASEAAELRGTTNDLQTEANNYKTWMGFAEGDTFDTVKKAFDDDVAKYGASFDEADRSYSHMVANLSTENQRLAKSEADAKSENKNLKAQLLATEKEKDLQIEKFSDEAQQAKADAEKERSEFNKQRKAMNDEKDKLSEQLTEMRGQIDKVNAAAAAATKKQQQEVADMSRDIEILEGQIPEADPFAQPEDGLVSWVNQKEQKVWINIGEDDALRPQVTFSVYSGDEADALKAETKGSIEVTKILGPHMAEARITNDLPTRPIMEGDKIYSQVWNPGRQVGFALAGILDMDGDDKSDIEELKSVIVLNNGKVDAQPGEDGTVEGQMTVDTRYLILGKFPESTLPGSEAQLKAWETMTQSADRLGIETITLDEFLNLMGWRPDRKTVDLGATAKPDDFPVDRGGDYGPPKNTTGRSNFRPRRPQPTY